MQRVELNVSCNNVWNEVAILSSYTGAKQEIVNADGTKEIDAEAYDRMLLTDDDQQTLSGLWVEVSAMATERLKEWIVDWDESGDIYKVVLSLPDNYDNLLNNSLELSLRRYFIQALSAQWFRLCNKSEAESRSMSADNMMKNVVKLILSRRRPARRKR